MKLKEFNPENCIPEKAGKGPLVSMNTKTGLFAINKAACELIGLGGGILSFSTRTRKIPRTGLLRKLPRAKAGRSGLRRRFSPEYYSTIPN